MLRLITLLLVAGALVACGDEDDGAPAASTPTATATAAPAELIGTNWTTTLDRSELDSPPDELKAESSDWTMSFKATGGNEGGPSVAIFNDEVGEIVNPISVSGDVITLEIPIDCKAFAYAVDGEQLTLTPTESCPANSITSVLTAKPWRRSNR